MSDLVKRLREWDQLLFGHQGPVKLDGPKAAALWKDVAEAANEIERMRGTFFVCERGRGEGVRARVVKP